MVKRLRNIFRELRKTGSHPGIYMLYVHVHVCVTYMYMYMYITKEDNVPLTFLEMYMYLQCMYIIHVLYIHVHVWPVLVHVQ